MQLNLKPAQIMNFQSYSLRDFDLYLKNFNNFLYLTDNVDKDDKFKIILFNNIVGTEVSKVIDTLNLADNSFEDFIAGLKKILLL